MRTLLVLVLILGGVMAALAQGTVNLGRCGTYPGVNLMVNGKPHNTTAFLRKGHAYVTARAILQYIGGNVKWVKGERAFYAEFPMKAVTIRVKPGSRTVHMYAYNEFKKHGQGAHYSNIQLAAAPMQCGGTVYIPAKTPIEKVGGSLHYDGSSRTLYLNPPKL